MTNIKSLCVYCGSSVGRRAVYADAARALAGELAARGIRLVYGGGSVGIMGVLADAMLAAGGTVVGVIPDALMRKELAHRQLTELHVTQSMHQRKMLMAELADGFVALPGGIGTLEEIFEVWTWAQLGLHDKPCGFLNVGRYFDALTAFLDHALAEEFVKPQHRAMLIVESDPPALLDRIAAYRPPAVPKWVGRGET
jgi:uncharacterized protein (TIGR00730 family)